MQTRELAVCIVEYNVYTSIATAVGILDAFDLFDANGSDAFGADDLFSCIKSGDVFLPCRPFRESTGWLCTRPS